MLKKVTTLLSVLISAALIASCGPSVNPQLKKKTDNLFSTAQTKNYGVSRAFKAPMKYAVGQYVVHGMTEGSGNRSITKTSIVGKEGNGWVMEFYSLNSKQEAVVQMLIVGLDKAAQTGNTDGIEIQRIKIKDEKGQVQSFEGPMLSMMKNLYKNSLSSLDVQTGTFLTGSAVTVPAGVFTGTYTIKSKVKLFGKTYTGTGWYHSSVPINGVVKSVSDDDKTTMVLLDFGTKGAVSLFD
ncbi:MAG: hypothetical protein CVV44_09160 [Spirochaetae bacterium HGW-Spirochaetae-1]|jgi:hypothetical protein|nr:MAG: hypothetical protein CVV44_09160 [Spirochaetae bacterium HGW-Spirochaetae-1]